MRSSRKAMLPVEGESDRPPGLRSATAWAMLLNGGRTVTTTFVLILLAGLLGPTAFGTVAIATLLVLVLQLSFQQGLAPALIHRADLDDDVLDVAFRLGLIGSLTMMSVVMASSEGMARVFNNEDLVPVVRVLSLLLPLFAFDLIPEMLARRASDFRLLAFRANVSALVGGLAGVVGAVAGLGVWALVLQQLVTAVLATALLVAKTPWRPRLHGPGWLAHRTVTLDLVQYSSRASAAAVAQFAATQVDSVIVGLFFGPRAVGYYRLASRVISTAFDVSVRSLQSALLPDLSRRQLTRSDSVHLQVLRVQRACCSSILPLFGVLVGISSSLPPLLGPVWQPATIPLLLLSITAGTAVLVALVPPLLQAVGEPGKLAWLNMQLTTALILVLCATAFAVHDLSLGKQLAAIAGARLGIQIFLTTPLSLALLSRMTGLSVRAIFRQSAPGILVAVMAGCSGLATAHALPNDSAAVSSAAVVLAAAGITAVLALGLVEHRAAVGYLRRRR